MRCDNCQYWKESDEWEPNAVGFRECGAIRARWDIEDDATGGLEKYPDNEPTIAIAYGDVGKRWHEARSAAFANERAYVQDGSQYRAELFTAPDFFCARFTPRD